MKFEAFYSVRRTFEADSEVEAYQKFYAWLQAKIEAAEIGTVVPVDEEVPN